MKTVVGFIMVVMVFLCIYFVVPYIKSITIQKKYGSDVNIFWNKSGEYVIIKEANGQSISVFKDPTLFIPEDMKGKKNIFIVIPESIIRTWE